MTGPGAHASAAERVAWSAPLPEADDGHLLTAPDGQVVVSTRRFLAVARPPGVVDWVVETAVGLLGAPVLLADGRISRYEDGTVVARDGATGVQVAAVPVGGPPALAALGTDLVCGVRSARGPVVRRIGPDGAVRWSAALVGELLAAPVIVDDLVVVADGPLLRGYDHAGRARWIAGARSFGEPDAPAAEVADGMVHGGPVALADGRLVAEVAERYGHRLVLFDPRARTVSPIRPPIAIRPPLAVVPPDGLAVLGPAEEVERGHWRWMVVLVDPVGPVRWAHRLSAEPFALVAAGSGRVAAMCSPPLGRWQRYQGWYDLSGDCFVRCVGADGAALWTWYPPVPLTFRPAAGADGTVLVGGPGRIWALDAGAPERAARLADRG
jgi:hypothetical protein